MPVKKVSTSKSAPRKKPSSKKSSTQKISREERANIKKAVNSLPSLLIEQTPHRKITQTKETPVTPTEVSSPRNETNWNTAPKPVIRVVPPSDAERKKRRLLQVVVGTIMIFIGSLWVINIRTKFAEADFTLGSEERLWQSAKKDFDTVVRQPQEIKEKLKQTTNEVEKIKAEEEVKKVLAKNLFLLTATSTTSSTLETTTSTQTPSTTQTNSPTSTLE